MEENVKMILDKLIGEKKLLVDLLEWSKAIKTVLKLNKFCFIGVMNCKKKLLFYLL